MALSTIFQLYHVQVEGADEVPSKYQSILKLHRICFNYTKSFYEMTNLIKITSPTYSQK
jgi:hypothetical protein